MKKWNMKLKEISLDTWDGVADYISRNTSTRKQAVLEWLKANYDDNNVLDLPPVFGKYISWSEFHKYLLNGKRIPTLKELKKPKPKSNTKMLVDEINNSLTMLYKAGDTIQGLMRKYPKEDLMVRLSKKLDMNSFEKIVQIIDKELNNTFEV